MSKYGVISSPNAGKYGPEITPYLDNFHSAYAEENLSRFNPRDLPVEKIRLRFPGSI